MTDADKIEQARQDLADAFSALENHDDDCRGAIKSATVLIIAAAKDLTENVEPEVSEDVARVMAAAGAYRRGRLAHGVTVARERLDRLLDPPRACTVNPFAKAMGQSAKVIPIKQG